MIVRSLSATNFMAAGSVGMSISETGCVTITGKNGSGKSTWIEIASWALWGETLRGHKPWRAQVVTTATAAVIAGPHEVVATRRHSGQKTWLEWSLDGAPQTYPTTTKAQEALERVIGTWNMWRRASVFSSADAAHFSTATDGDRKRLLEAFLGCDRFDPALSACRIDKQAAASEVQRAEAAKEKLRRDIEQASKRAEDARAALDRVPLVAPDMPLASTVCADDYVGHLASCDAEIQGLRSLLLAAVARDAEYTAAAKSAQAQLERLRGLSGTCPTCLQVISPDVVALVEERAVSAQASAEAARYEGASSRQEAEDALADLEVERRQLYAAHQKAIAASAQRAGMIAQNAANAKQREALSAQITAMETEAYAKSAELVAVDTTSCSMRLAELTACERVLGLKGLRSAIISRCLVGVEGLANAWLARMPGGTQITFAQYTDKAGDAIRLDITGAGGGTGYIGSSGGERRRVDIAILLALAEVASASSGQSAGTLWLDEVFDALDADGVSAIAPIVEELALTRSVIVITHRADLVDRLRGARRVVMVGGGIA